MSIKYKYKKLVIKLKNYNKQHVFNKLNKTQLLDYEIVKTLINKEDSKLSIAMISDLFYIQNNDYFVKMSHGTIMIINGKFSYYIDFPEIIIEDLRIKFNNRNEFLTLKIEQKIISNTIKSLETIAKDLNITTTTTNNNDNKLTK